MADRQDNRTEQWLKDYASHRREQHGSAPKMHDATRHLLRGEVRRTWGQPAPAVETADGWESWLLRFATGTVVVGALAVGAWVSFDGGNQVPNRAEDTGGPMKMTKTVPAEAGDSLDAQRDEKSSVAAGANKAEQPEPVEIADVDVIVKKAGTQKALAAPASAYRSIALSARENSLPQRDVLRNMRRNFTQRVHVVRNNNLSKPQAASAPAPRQEVMEDFEIIRSGKTIQVRDRDGSIYKGRVILASATTPMMAAIPGQGGGGLPPGGGGLPPGGGGPLPHDEEKLRKFSGSVDPKRAARSLGAPPVPPGKGLRPARKSAVNPVQKEVYNDNFSRHLSVKLNKTIIGHNIHATPEPLENGFLNFHGRSVWYSFEIKPRDFESREYGMVTISTRGSNFDTTLGVFVADRNNGLVIPSGSPSKFWDDNQPNVPWSEVKIPIAGPRQNRGGGGNGNLQPKNAIPGQGGGLPGGGGGAPNNPQPPESPLKYYIAIDGVNGATGQIRLNVRWATSSKDVEEAKRRLIAHNVNTHFYFQVAGTNRTSGRQVKFEGFMRNASFEEKEDALLKDSPNEHGRSVAAAPLRIQGRVSYGGRRVNVDAFTAALTPASALKLKRQKK